MNHSIIYLFCHAQLKHVNNSHYKTVRKTSLRKEFQHANQRCFSFRKYLHKTVQRPEDFQQRSTIPGGGGLCLSSFCSSVSPLKQFWNAAPTIEISTKYCEEDCQVRCQSCFSHIKPIHWRQSTLEWRFRWLAFCWLPHNGGAYWWCTPFDNIPLIKAFYVVIWLQVMRTRKISHCVIQFLQKI